MPRYGNFDELLDDKNYDTDFDLPEDKDFENDAQSDEQQKWPELDSDR